MGFFKKNEEKTKQQFIEWINTAMQSDPVSGEQLVADAYAAQTKEKYIPLMGAATSFATRYYVVGVTNERLILLRLKQMLTNAVDETKIYPLTEVKVLKHRNGLLMKKLKLQFSDNAVLTLKFSRLARWISSDDVIKTLLNNSAK